MAVVSDESAKQQWSTRLQRLVQEFHHRPFTASSAIPIGAACAYQEAVRQRADYATCGPLRFADWSTNPVSMSSRHGQFRVYARGAKTLFSSTVGKPHTRTLTMQDGRVPSIHGRTNDRGSW